MTNWADAARATIASADRTVPADATLAERTKIIDAAYPFGVRQYWPYKAWLKARKAYLARFQRDGSTKPPPPTALDLLPRDPITGRPML